MSNTSETNNCDEMNKDCEESKVSEVSSLMNSENTITSPILARKIRKTLIVASDSEDEEQMETNNAIEEINEESGAASMQVNLESDDEESSTTDKQKKKPFKLIDSDSDDNDVENSNDDKPDLEESHNLPEKPKKPFKLIDTDSEPEEDIDKVQTNNEQPIYTINSKKELVVEKSIAETLKELCDSSSDEENSHIKPLAYKKKYKKSGENVQERKMTPKEAAEQRKEIESVSQKMIRESNVLLPYHKPKQRSLKEFLQQRPRFASAIPDEIKKNSAGGIKMSTEQLLIVSKKIEERHKQVEEFYKSESEEEEEEKELATEELENDNNVIVNVEDQNNKEEVSTEVIESKTETDNLETKAESQNENEILQESNGNLQNSILDGDATETELNESFPNTSNQSIDLDKDSSIVFESNVNSDSDDENNEDELQTIVKNIQLENKTTPEIVKEKKIEVHNRFTEIENDMEIDEASEETKHEEENLENPEEITETKENSSTKNKIEILSHFKINLPTRDGILLNIQPKLSGAPNHIIDLDEGTTKPDEVIELMQRFEKHVCKKPLQKKPSEVELDVMCVSQGGEVHKEKIALRVEKDITEPSAVEKKPGAQMQKLRNDLQRQMALKREELRKQKELRLQKEKAEQEEENEIYKGEKSDCGIDAILDDDEEEEFTDIESTDEEEDEEEKELQGGTNNVLIDCEAEEDEIDHEEFDEDDINEEANESEEIEETKESSKKKLFVKPLRRIIQPVDDSDSDEEVKEKEKKNHPKEEKKLCIDSTISLDEDDDALVPAGQTNSCRTPLKQHAFQSKSEMGFLSPVCCLTGLQSFDETGKFLQNSPGSPAIKLGEPSPFKSKTFSKSLFDQSPVKACDIKQDKTNTSGLIETQIEPSTQDLMELCSGNFGFTQSEDTVIEKKVTHEETNSNNIETTTENDKHNRDKLQNEILKQSNENLEENFITKKKEIINIGNKVEEAKIDEEDDRFISQLIDEDELETFKKKFESPCEPENNKTMPNSVIAAKLKFDAEREIENDDEEEDDDDDDINITTKGKRNKIVDSDEEYEDNLSTKDREEIDLHEDIEDENEEECELVNEESNKQETEIGYDSEENEITVEKPKKMKMKDFLENEAELSGSDWDSEDEDEKGLDILEMELGDEEKFNQNKLRSELERIHMRQILDKDKKDIKALQELLMDEDEELAGAGRQRQFRWKNLDNAENVDSNILNISSNNEDGDEEDEDEEGWRKKRYERELFLQSQKESQPEETNETDSLISSKSQIFKLGQRAIIKNYSSTKKPAFVINTKQAYTLNTQRGSFLSRKDEVLTRVAEYNKVADMNLAAAKNSRNFVFQTVEKSTTSTNIIEDKKRKAADAGTPAQLKRLRLNGISPAQQKKTESRSKARLFNNSQW